MPALLIATVPVSLSSNALIVLWLIGMLLLCAALFVAVQVGLSVGATLTTHGLLLAGREFARQWRRWPRVVIIVLTGLSIVAVHWWSSTSEPLLIYGAGPRPLAIQRIVYHYTLEPEGSLLVTEEVAMTFAGARRAPHRPLLRDQPVSDVSLTVDGRPAPAQVIVGPQYGIRLGRGAPAGEHVYHLTYRLHGSTRTTTTLTYEDAFLLRARTGQDAPPLPVQEVRWQPPPWDEPGVTVTSWRFPRPFPLAEFGELNVAYSLNWRDRPQPDPSTIECRCMLLVQDGRALVPAGMTEARPPPSGAWRSSLWVLGIPVVALVAVLRSRKRVASERIDQPPLVVEYAPPNRMSPLELGFLVGAPANQLVAAEIADLVERGALQVNRLRSVQLLRPDGDDDEFVATGRAVPEAGAERDFLLTLTDGGKQGRLSRLVAGFSPTTAKIVTAARSSLAKGGYYNPSRDADRTLGLALALLVLVGGPYATFFLVNQAPWLLPGGGTDLAKGLAFIEPALIAWVLAAMLIALHALSIPVLTPSGVAARPCARIRGVPAHGRVRPDRARA